MENYNHNKHQTGYVFLLIFILLSAGIIIGGYLAYRNYEKNYRTEVENQLSIVADLKVNQLVQWRKERLGDGQVFYKNDLFSATVKRYIQNRNDHDAKTGILAWVRQIQKAHNYDLMMLLDAQFNTILVFPENKERTHLIIDQKNTEILLSGNIAFQDFYRNNQDQHIYLKILVPILKDSSPKQLIGVLALRISPEEYLYPLIKNWPTQSRTSETLIIRRDGDSAVFLNDLKFQKDAALSLRIPLESRDVPAVRAALGQKGIVEGIDYRGVPVIAYICAVPDSPWFLVARTDIEEVYTLLRERLWLMVFLIGALLISAGASVGFVWRQQHSRFYQKQYESAEALRESGEKFRAIFENNSSAIAIIEPDTTISMVNDAYCQMSGYTKEEVIGMSWTQQIPQEDLKRFKEYNRRRLSNPQDAPDKYEFKFYKKGGEIRYGLMSVSYMQNARKIITSFIDITERKQAENELRKLTRAVEQSPASIVITDTKGAIQYVNPKFVQITGYSLEEAIGKNSRILKSDEKSSEEYKQLWDTITSGKTWRGEFHNKKKNGELYWEFAVISPITDELGITTNFLAVKEDITERKQFEAEREKLITDLQTALADIKTLGGLIPICSSCKKIRDDKGYWNILEAYLMKHSDAQFTHGICPDCMAKLYPDFVNSQSNEQGKNKT